MNNGWMYLLLGVICGVIGSLIVNYIMGFLAYKHEQKAGDAFDNFMRELMGDQTARIYKDENGNVTIFTGDEENGDAKDDTDRAADSEEKDERDCGAETEDGANADG